MMQEIMDQEERVMLDQIAKLTEENHVEWACDEYNPIGFLDKDDDSEQSACICQMFQFSAVLNGFHYELELAEYINVMPHDQMFPKWKHLIYRYGTTSSPSCGSFLVSSFRCPPPAERTSYENPENPERI